MPADAKLALLPKETAETPAARCDAPPAPRPNATPQRSDVPTGTPSAAEKAPGPSRRRWVRGMLFALLPLVLIAGGYWYVTSGQVMSTDDAYVEADKVGISTDVSGIVKQIDVGNNQEVAVNQVLFRMDDLPFRLALERAEAQVGIVRNDLNALKANYGDMEAQIKQAQYDIEYYDREFHRQQDLASRNIASQQTFDTARRNFQNAQQKVASLNQQLAAIAANLNGDPSIPVEQHPRYRDAVAQRNEAARQLDHTVVKAPFAGIVTNVPSIAPGKYLQASMTAFYLVATDHLWVELEPERDGVDVCTTGPARHGDRRHVPGFGMAWHNREHQSGSGARVRAPAGAEHQWKLGEGRAARPNARARRHER